MRSALTPIRQSLCHTDASTGHFARVAQVASAKAKRLGLVHDLIEPLGPGLNAPDEITLAHLEKMAIEAAKYAIVLYACVRPPHVRVHARCCVQEARERAAQAAKEEALVPAEYDLHMPLRSTRTPLLYSSSHP